LAIAVSALALFRKQRTSDSEMAQAARDVAEAAARTAGSSHDLIEYFERRNAILEAQLEQMGEQPIKPTQTNAVWTTGQLIYEHFSEDEIELLAMELALDRPAGDTRELQATHLVVAAKQRGLFKDLHDIVQRRRPNVRWPK
jgi:hypothetical protein